MAAARPTLVGLLLLNDAELNFDLYEGYLPTGGNTGIQAELLSQLRLAANGTSDKLITVRVEDNLFSTEDAVFRSMGVQAQHFKADFSVGHTANYPGYFPLILFHQYTDVWFNIERSAEHRMAIWHNESINHQWCKSEEYQLICTELFAHVTGVSWFNGFGSTLPTRLG